MEFTRRAWGVTAAAGALAVLAVVLSRPLLLVGTAMVGGWLLARQWRFVTDAREIIGALSVSQSPDREQIAAGESVAVTLRAVLPRQLPLHIRVRATPPVGTKAPPETERTVRLSPNTDRGRTVFPLPCPIAGRHSFGDVQVAVKDRAGLFTTQFPVDADVDIYVSPRTPRQVHVGEGGEQVAAFGDHETGEFGPGIEAARVREYVPGDAVRNIDWKATARLNEPYIREHEVTSDRQTVLVVDHRTPTGAGPPGERKLDYLRHVAVAYLNVTRQNDEAVGLIAVGDGGITTHVPPAADKGHYERLARLLYGLEATDERETDSRQSPKGAEMRSPAAARRVAETLTEDESAFARRLRPFFESATTYADRVVGDPLYAAVQREMDSEATTSMVILTDDTHQIELREALDLAESDNSTFMIYLAPSILFTTDTDEDIERVYDTYVQFEEFRRELAARPRVTAYEVTPEDRIEALLAAGRANR